MAKLPPFKRFSNEDFPNGIKTRDDTDKLFSPLNEFTTRMSAALVNDLSVSENFRGQVSTLNVTTRSGYTAGSAQASIQAGTFLDAGVNTGTDTITITSHGFSTGQKIRFTNSGGALPTGLTAGVDYWVISTGTNTFKVSNTLSNTNGTAVDITAAAGAGTHTATIYVDSLPYVELTTALKLKVTMAVKPIGLLIWKATEVATNATIIRQGLSADWNYADGVVTISSISGLFPGRTYTITMALFGG